MKTIKSKQMIRNFLKKFPSPPCYISIWFLERMNNHIELNEQTIKIHPSRVLKTFLKESIKIENKKNFVGFIFDNEFIERQKEFSKLLFTELLHIGRYDKSMVMS